MGVEQGDMIIERLVVGPLQTNCYLVGCPQTKEGIVIDPGGDAKLILAEVRRLGLKIKYIVNTHGHFDHTLANEEVVEATGAQLAIHPADAAMLTKKTHKALAFLMGFHPASPPAEIMLHEGDVVAFGNLRLSVLHTPGHTPGGISLLANSLPISASGAQTQGGVARWLPISAQRTYPQGGETSHKERVCNLGHGVVFTGDALFHMGIGRADLPGGNYQKLMESIRNKLLTLPDETVVYPGHGPPTTIGAEREHNPFLR